MDFKYLNKLHNEQLQILLKFDKFCKSNSIDYFLEGGTALGAMRHKGFIPWDDDIDVGMFREDYDRLLDICAELPDELKLRTSSNTRGFAPMFAKLCRKGTVFSTQETVDSKFDQEIFIDIFVYDSLVKDEKKKKWQIKNARKWQSISYLYNSRHISNIPSGVVGFVEKIAINIVHLVLHSVLNQSYINRKYNRSVFIQEDRDDAYVPLSYTQVASLPKQYFFPCQVANFEGHMLPIPNMVEDYLKNIYGDWRRLPPIDERRTHLPKKIVFSDGEVWEESKVR